MKIEAILVPPFAELITNPEGFNTEVNTERNSVSLWGRSKIGKDSRWSKGIAVINNQAIVKPRTELEKMGLYQLEIQFRFLLPSHPEAVRTVIMHHQSGMRIATVSPVNLSEEKDIFTATAREWEKIGVKKLHWFGYNDPRYLSEFKATFETF